MERSWKPGNPLPREFEEVLFDEDEEDADDDVDVLEEDVDNDEIDFFLNGYRRDVASKIAISPLTVGNRSPVVDRSPASGQSSAPIQSPAPERFRIEVLPSPPSERGWMRGELLQQQYVADAELPEQLRQDISRILAAIVNVRRRLNVDDDMRVDEGLIMNDYDINEAFVWRPMSDWNGVKERFLQESTGPTRHFDNAYQALHSFWTNDILMSHIAVESNRYAQSLSASRPRFARD
ncbi:uncharacterized protein LOC114357677 [Ostrinia furnacalis]|uniref:uncharacterized protein LOC114357677 n=1 Tax=Ostrinia furnacalis TaxID=93504 RepID=UPI00103C7D14|nr:uncharacterized protein LOC114357677 [Ostrinia furnacalis]